MPNRRRASGKQVLQPVFEQFSLRYCDLEVQRIFANVETPRPDVLASVS